MVFPVIYRGNVYRVASPSLVKNRISLANMTPEEEEDKTIRVLRSIRYYARLDNNNSDIDTIMGVFAEANRQNLLPDFMKKYNTIPARTTPKHKGLTKEEKTVISSAVMEEKSIREPFDENSIFI